jgi:hypothetical protein
MSNDTVENASLYLIISIILLRYLNRADNRDVMAEVIRSISDAMNLLGPGILGNGIFVLRRLIQMGTNSLPSLS